MVDVVMPVQKMIREIGRFRSAPEHAHNAMHKSHSR
jgi:hypothetical protein